jgi:F420-non-reducing hydrogenase iron-sulfur subunit
MFEPRIVCFFCKWCTYAGADLAGTSRKQYPPNGVVVRVNCSGRIDPQHILWAFREGADGVLIGGCHPGDCHYQDGNMKTMRRVVFLKRLLEAMGIEPERLRLEWISAAEGEKLVRVMTEFVDAVKGLGPLELGLTRGPGRERPKTTYRAAAKKAPTKRDSRRRAAAKKVSVKRPARKAPVKPRTKAKARKIAQKPARRK